MTEQNSYEEIYTIIPTGGEGKRLRPYTETRSKPLVPIINNFPILEFILYSLAYGAGLRHFIFGVKGTRHYTFLRDYFEGGSGWSGKLEIEPKAHFEYQNPNYNDTGSADSVRYNINQYEIKTPIIVSQADNLFWGADIKELYNQAMQSPYPFVVGLTKVEDASQLGVAVVDKKSHKVLQFLEKPGEAYKNGGVVNSGIYVIKPQVFNELKDDFGKDTIPALVQKGLVGGFELKHGWYDFGDPHKHLLSTLSLLKNPTPCFENFLSRVCTGLWTDKAKVWVRGKSSFSFRRAQEIIEKIRSGKIIAEGAVFIGKDSVIGDNVYLRDCALGDLAFVGDGCEIVQSNILDAWQIGKNCKIYDSFLGRGGRIADGLELKGQFLGDNSVIETVG